MAVVARLSGGATGPCELDLLPWQVAAKHCCIPIRLGKKEHALSQHRGHGRSRQLTDKDTAGGTESTKKSAEEKERRRNNRQ